MDVMARRRAIMAHVARLVKKIISSVTGLVSFVTNVVMPTKVVCEFSPIQEGTGDPSPDNVRPISGWDGCEILHTGKNLLDSSQLVEGHYYDNNGVQQTLSDFGYTAHYSRIKSGTSYVLSGAWTNLRDHFCAIYFYDKEKQWIRRVTFDSSQRSYAFTTPDNAEYIRVQYYGQLSYGQIELGSTATAYEPYQGKTVQINWKLPDEYQEVEFITANGNQYFWSDVLIQDGLTVDAKQSFNGGDSYLFGGHADNTGNNRCAYNGMYNQRVQSAYPSYFLTGAVTSDGTVFHIITTFKEGHRTIYIDGVNVMDDSRGTAVQETGKYCVVFGQRSKGDDMPGTVSNTYRGSLYSLKVSKNSVLLADYVPCYRKADSKPGMYDLVTGTFYVNQGTGNDFTVGPDASTLPGTVYGGTVTLNEDGSADLVVSIGYAEITGGVNKGTNSKYYSDDTTYGYTSIGFAYDKTNYTINGAYSSWLRSYGGAVWNHIEQHNIYGAHTNPSIGNIALRVDNSVIGATAEDTIEERVEKFNTYLSAHPLQICAKLATPQTYHFDNISQLNSFLGENNIWHNMNGDITVEYWNKQ